MKIQLTTRANFSIALVLTAALFLISILFASSLVSAQGEPTLIEKGLPGPAFAGVIPAPNGRLYGLTYEGGTSNKGTLYSVDSALSAVVVHHNFSGADGAIPYDELTYDSISGKFYGTTSHGGPNNNLGTIFSFDPTTNTLVTLKGDFDVNNYNAQGPLVVSGGYLYGSLAYHQGAVFRMAIDGSDFTIIHSFDPVEFGSLPQALTLGQDGKLYGVALYNGILCDPQSNLRCGTVFRLKPVLPGDTDVQFETLYQIQDRFDASPLRRVVYGSDGLLYFCSHRRIFRLNPQDPNPASTFQRIWDETGGSISMSIMEGSDNRLYAANYSSGTARAGRVFSINKDGSGEINLRTFSFTTGSEAYGPYGVLYRNSSGTIYGTTEYNDLAAPFYGTVFAINVSGNSPPVLSNVAVTSPISENDTATLTGNITDPNANDTFTMTVDWGDGSPPQVFNYPAGTTSFIETHQYLDDNPTATPSDNYTINLTLSDGIGSDADSTPITVNNAAPTLNNIAVNPSTISVGGTTTLSGTVNDAGTLDPHDLIINWGDGSPNTVINLAAGVTAFNVNHQYNAGGAFTIGVTATDDDGGSGTGSVGITVSQPPVLSNVAVTTPINENDSTTLSGNISDPNAGDAFTLTVDWGDGSPVQVFNYPAGTSAFSQTHQYLDDNPTATSSDNYAISLTLSDGSGNDNDSAVVTVNNATPVLSNVSASPATINAGGTTNLSGTVSDAGALDTHQIVINWGDGSPTTTLNLAAGVTSFNSNHQYNTSGNFNVSVTATDDDTGSANGGTSVTVNPSPQQPPVLSNVAVTSPINENGTAVLSGNISDPNAGDTFTLTVNWGDGSPAQVFNLPAGTTSFGRTHQYLDDNPSGTGADNYTISLLLSDNAGGSDTDAVGLTVANVAPTLSGIAASPSTITVGSSITLSGTVNDTGTLDSHDVTINWSDGSPNTVINLAVGVTTFSASHQYNATGNFNIAVTASDDDTGSASGSASVRVNAASNEKIVFTSARDGNFEIYSMNADGTNHTRLTNNPGGDITPAFSPDGNRIAFASVRNNNLDIYVMNADGSNQTRLTTNGSDDYDPAFSPDGSRIAFTSTRNGNYEIYVMNANGSNETRLTNNAAFDGASVFSPDGSRIAFLSFRNGNGEIYAMNSDGTNQTRLTNDPADDYGATFSPDGSQIVFASTRDGNAEIYSMSADGTNQTRLTINPATDAEPSFSPDGSRVAFDSNRDGNYEIYSMNADGTDQTRLTSVPAFDSSPAFRPVSQEKIVFTSFRDGNYEIYIMNSDGSNQTRLTNNAANDGSPSLSPDGSRIAFLSDRNGNFEIYVMNADGSNPTNLTKHPAFDYQPSFSPDGGRIAFVSTRNANFDIYVMNSDGTNTIRLTTDPARDFGPSFSPDGRQIAFDSERTGVAEIYVMNSNGTNQNRLTFNSRTDSSPRFSPDGSRIAFHSFRDGNFEIYVMNADGSNQINLTSNPAVDSDPFFSPDGNRIAFESDRDGNLEVYVMGADGSNPTRLTNSQGFDFNPVFRVPFRPAAPEKIAFSSSRDGNSEIYVMNPDGSNQTRLTNNPTNDSEAAFSSDGSKIVFTSNRTGNYEIYVMNADGSNQTQLTNHPTSDTDPSFSPDGSRIAFASSRDGNPEIYVMNADGSNPTRLTTNPGEDFDPSFSPDGSKIAFASRRGGNYDIYVMNANGTNQTRITNDQGVEDTPSFSPDGSRILFIHYKNVNKIDIYIMNANGTNQTKLTNGPAWDVEPSFSQDGSRIAFCSNRDGNFEIYVMNADGSNQIRLTNDPTFDFYTSWGR